MSKGNGRPFAATRVLREAGGLGDVVMSLVVARALKEKWPDLPLFFFCLRDYQGLVMLSPDVDYFVPVSGKERRPRDTKHDAKAWPYLDRPANAHWVETAECWCPAFRHERDHGHKSWEGRIETMLNHNNLTLATMCPQLVVSEYAKGWAHGWAAARFGASGVNSMIGLQPLSHNPRRDWPMDRWVALSKELTRLGWNVLVFHSFPYAVREMPGHKVCAVPLWQLAAITQRCRLIIGPDSGLYHLAAAVNTPAIGLFGSTSSINTTRPYPLHTGIWEPDPPAHKDCKPPCFSFGWEGCDERCRKGPAGCQILRRIKLTDVMNRIQEIDRVLARRGNHAALDHSPGGDVRWRALSVHRLHFDRIAANPNANVRRGKGL